MFAEQALSRLAQEAGVWVTVDSVQGSVPRNAGTWMAVFASGVVGSIGGGRVEVEATDEARRRLAQPGTGPAVRRYPLGPALGQCCGGVMHLRFETVAVADVAALRQRCVAVLAPVALFGGGHVGHALIEVLGRLPFQVTWIDSRDEIFPAQLPLNVACEYSDPVHRAVDALAPCSAVLVMSFSHAEDLDILAACVLRARQQQDLPYIGLIGSDTKWATFRHRLEAKGFGPADFDRVTCPIGIDGIEGKQPEVIAVAVAAQLLQR